MRITFILPDLGFGGGTKAVVIHAHHLVKRGHTVTLVSPPFQKPSIFKKVIDRIKGATLNAWPEIMVCLPEARSLDFRLLERRRPVVDNDVPDSDAVIATWWETAEWVNGLSPSKGAKLYFIQAHEVFPYLPIERCHATYRMSLHKIVVATWLKNVMRRVYDDEDVVVVPNSIDHSQFFAANRRKQSHPTVGILYSTTPSKGFHTSQAAIRQLRKNLPNVHIVYFGNEIPTNSEQLDANDLFHYRPPQDKIREIYSACDVWLTSSTTEGFNLPAMEAMACGTPVVSTRTGWPAESIIQYTNGILVEIGDVAALASGLEWVLTRSDSEWLDLSDAAIKTVEDSSWEHSASLFEAALMRFATNIELDARDVGGASNPDADRKAGASPNP
jgi:glycosyltransferase involved in cell wall biosynthesis